MEKGEISKEIEPAAHSCDSTAIKTNRNAGKCVLCEKNMPEYAVALVVWVHLPSR